ncbi:MAG: hypothetical protein HY725_21245 [Candidatus Rokubacteria bacterium]|nr:hypothetical protein [Candidatus Rokubacteria bacterium]
MKERRRSSRQPASWPVYLWLSDTYFLLGHTLEVSAHGMRLGVSHGELSGLVKPGQPVRVQVILGGMEGGFTRVGKVRHVTAGSIGVEITEDLPLEVVAATSIEDRISSVSDSGQEGGRKFRHYIRTRGQGQVLLGPIPQLG